MSEYFSLSECDVIGFDLDHTLCRYHLKETSRLIYESFARYLVEHKGYDPDLLHLTPATWDFCFKGLVVDLEDGNLVKLAEDGTVLRATHGTKDLSAEEILRHYGPKREWKHFESLNTSFTRSAHYYFYDNYFDLPGALLCGRVVDMLNKRGDEVSAEFWKDMVAAIDHNYNTSAFKEDAGTYFPSVKQDPGRYLQPCSEEVKAWLRSMKRAGKVLLLITSSHSDYCRLICEHILGKDYEELFDIIITNALKPGFFSLVPHQRPFRTLVNDVEESEGLLALDKPGWYSQGNWPHLHQLLKTMTGKPEPKVVYFGDSMRSDMFPASSFGRWETVMVVEEMEGEGVPTSAAAARANQGHVQAQEQAQAQVHVQAQAQEQVHVQAQEQAQVQAQAQVQEQAQAQAQAQEQAQVQAQEQAQVQETKAKFEDQGMKAPSDSSQQWGSYFVDVHKSAGGEGEEKEAQEEKLTWCCHSIHKYSTMAIPSVEHIAGLPLDYKFPRFSPDKPSTTGYYPRPPDSLLGRRSQDMS